jgi:cytochrome d ubiquinol oxidase subunit II
MDLNTIWYIIITILFCGFFFLEGFDYGVGLLLPFLTRKDQERRAIINTIGPVWDGNEVWMITAGAALFAALPGVYASLTSGFYLAMFFMITGLIIRAVGFEYRSKRDETIWRKRWDWAIFFGSLIPAYFWGLMISNLMRGIALEENAYYYGGLIPLLNPYALFGALVFLGLFTLHGASFLGIKLLNPLKDRAKKTAQRLWLPVTILAAGFLIWTYLTTELLNNPGLDGLVPGIITALALVGYGVFLRMDREMLTFVSGGAAILSATVMIFAGLFPNIMISTLDPAFNLTIYNSASSPIPLRLMSIVVLIFLPLVMLYQGWTYWIFRQRIGPDSPDLHY